MEYFENRHQMFKSALEDHAEVPEEGFGNWLREVRRELYSRCGFSNDCCKFCDDQRIIDLFYLRFYAKGFQITEDIFRNNEKITDIYDLAHVCETLDGKIQESGGSRRDSLKRKNVISVNSGFDQDPLQSQLNPRVSIERLDEPRNWGDSQIKKSNKPKDEINELITKLSKPKRKNIVEADFESKNKNVWGSSPKRKRVSEFMSEISLEPEESLRPGETKVVTKIGMLEKFGKTYKKIKNKNKFKSKNKFKRGEGGESNNNDEISKGQNFNNYETLKGQIFTPQMLKDMFEERPQFVNVDEEIRTLVEIMTTKSRPFGKDITLEYQGAVGFGKHISDDETNFLKELMMSYGPNMKSVDMRAEKIARHFGGKFSPDQIKNKMATIRKTYGNTILCDTKTSNLIQWSQEYEDILTSGHGLGKVMEMLNGQFHKDLIEQKWREFKKTDKFKQMKKRRDENIKIKGEPVFTDPLWES